MRDLNIFKSRKGRERKFLNVEIHAYSIFSPEIENIPDFNCQINIYEK